MFQKKTFAWSDFYNKSITYDVKNEKEEFNSNSKTLKITLGDAYILSCFFHDMHSSQNGGAILFSLKEMNILVEKCSFFNCSTAQFTAAVKVTSGNSIIAFTCGQNCKAKSDGFVVNFLISL